MDPDLAVKLIDGTLETHVVLWVIHSEMVAAWHDFNTRMRNDTRTLELTDFKIAPAFTFDKVAACWSSHACTSTALCTKNAMFARVYSLYVPLLI